jgi:membrane protein YdbS with pleckstrin-like domain
MISRLSVVPYGRMQFIDVVAGPIERAYGLATVRMHTAAAADRAPLSADRLPASMFGLRQSML